MIEGMLISPIVGAIGGLASQWFARDAKKLDIVDRENQRKHDREMAVITHQQAIELTKVEAEAATRKVLMEGEVKMATADLDNLNAAIQSMPKWSGIQSDDSPAMKWFKTIIEATATLTRILVTVGAAGLLGWLAYLFTKAMMVSPLIIPQSIQGDIVQLVMLGVVELSLLATGFWFGARGTQLKRQDISSHQQ